LVRAESFFRYQIMIRYRAMTRLSQVLSAMEASLNLPEDVHLVMDVDPVNLM
jgi:primosomal protein N'